jgi:hypothetical protein
MSEADFHDLVGTAKRNNSASQGATIQRMEQPVCSSGEIQQAVSLAGVCRSWAASDGNFMPIGESHATLPRGLFNCRFGNHGPYLEAMENNVDSLVDLPDSESERLLAEVMQFRTLKTKFGEHGFLYKRGILLWGPPGSGKTVTIQQLLRMFVTDGDGIALMVENPAVATACMHMNRKIEPERQILAIMEDLDALIETWGETNFLNVLDGESQLQNVVYVATTNYPERLDKRFVDRPSRFDTIRKIGMPSDAARLAYLKIKAPVLTSTELSEYVEGTNGFSIAYLRELVVLTMCFGHSLDSALERLNSMRKKQPNSSDANGSTFGFI